MTYAVREIPGLQYIPNYVSKQEQAELLSVIDCEPWLTDLKRRVQHYGYRYDYKTRSIHSTAYLGPLPDWSLPLAKRLYWEGLIGEVPDQMIINEYYPGQGIASHVDCIPCFGDTILSLSLGSSCVINYTRIRDSREIPMLLEERSLVVMQGESRNWWKHGILPHKTDIFDGQTFQRSRRISMTFRKVII